MSIELTDEQIMGIWSGTPTGSSLREDVVSFARALLAASPTDSKTPYEWLDTVRPNGRTFRALVADLTPVDAAAQGYWWGKFLASSADQVKDARDATLRSVQQDGARSLFCDLECN